MFADVILPLALPKRTYTYAVPEQFAREVQPGVRVEVQFGQSKIYSGLVGRVHAEQPDYRVKPVISVLDEVTVVSPQQLRLWDWLAEYYACTLGEVMAAALPSHLKLTSETKLVLAPDYAPGDGAAENLDADEYLIAEALGIQQEISIDDARKILNKRTVFPVVQRLIQKGVLFLREDFQEKFRPKKVRAVRFAEPYRSQPDLLREAFELVDKKHSQRDSEAGIERADRQVLALMALVQLTRNQPFVRKQELLDKAQVTDSTLKSLQRKGIIELYDQEVSRLAGREDELAEADALSEQQVRALAEIRAHFQEKSTVLLHGATGSGKTRVYVELIRETIAAGGQVLYLLPEIALTSQIINRLQKIFGADVAAYHSKLGYNERVEIWTGAASGKPILLGARSSLFLPFRNLKLIVVDEEHDPSFKQYDPAPRYSARDAAIFLANIYGAKVLLGTATPSVESWHNAATGKYGLVEMPERFGGLQLPEIQMINLVEMHKSRQMQSLFSPPLLEALERTLAAGEQAILFQNRRGYSPILQCQTCGWSAMCKHCDVSLTFHKHTNRLRCHYCGYQIEPIALCPACGSGKLTMQGFGTEKIEDELKIFLPKAKIGRMDLDTAGSKTSLANLLNDFEERRLDVLVGTQMVTKGLDFDNVAVVGVLGADALVKFPDFRASERAFQLLTQVAGRAGRKQRRGLVLIQAFNPAHPVLREVLQNDFRGFIARELAERQAFNYPPFTRLIAISVRHKDDKTVHAAAAFLGKSLRQRLGERVLGPVIPNIPRIRSYFHQDILLKLEKSAPVLAAAKQLIRESAEILCGKPSWGQVQVVVDVDPM